MKNIFTLLITICAFSFVSAQLTIKAPNGDVGIGTDTPGVKLDLISTESFISKFTGTANNFTRIIVNSDQSVNSGIQFQTGGMERWSTAAFQNDSGNVDYVFYNDVINSSAILLDGDTNNADFGGTISSMGSLITSDVRYKKNIKKMKIGLKEILQLNPITFNYTDEINKGMDTNFKFIGIEAQELQKIIPEAVSNHIQNILDENATRTGNTKDILKIQSDAIQYILINAIKEQQNIINDQESAIDNLEAKLKANIEALELLESRVDKIIGSMDVNPTTNSNETTGGYVLYQNNPNPLQNNTTIKFNIENKYSKAEIKITDQSGRTIKTININNNDEEVVFEKNNLPSGVYYYQLIVDNILRDTKKMSIIN